MRIGKVHIQNIKSISNFTLDFGYKPGWHVLLGDNGAGKSTILKAIATTLIGNAKGFLLQQNFDNWIKNGEETGISRVALAFDENFDRTNTKRKAKEFNVVFFAMLKDRSWWTLDFGDVLKNGGFNEIKNGNEWFPESGCFSASFGAFRKIGKTTGLSDDTILDERVGAHLTLFFDTITLSTSFEWLKSLKFQIFDKKINKKIIESLISFYNNSGLLSEGVMIDEIGSQGIIFKDTNGNHIDLFELSDGYKTIFALSAEIIRQLTLQYGQDFVFEHYNEKTQSFKLPGVVLIDEVDIHLHPSWQARIGEWFTTHFPQIQFIVTTHSPIICQSAAEGTIWRLEHSSSSMQSRQMKGQEFDRLVYGNVLEAFDTSGFGTESFTQSKAALEKRQRLARLNIKSIKGTLSTEETAEYNALRQIFPPSV